MIVSIFLSLPHCALNIFTTAKRVNHGEDGLEVPANFDDYVPEKIITLPKKQNNKDRRKLTRNCKALSKVKHMKITCKKCLLWPTIERLL